MSQSDTAEIWRTQRFDSEGVPGLRCSIRGASGRVHDRPKAVHEGHRFDAVSSVWASLRRKMVRGEGFEPPTNSV